MCEGIEVIQFDDDLKEISFEPVNKYKCKCIVGDKKVYLTNVDAMVRDNKRHLVGVRVLMTLSSLVMFLGIFGIIGMLGNSDLGITLPFEEALEKYIVFITMSVIGCVVVVRFHSVEEVILRRLHRLLEKR